MKKDILKLDYEIFDKADWQTWEKLRAFKNLFLFSLKDLASNKAYVIGRRGTWKGYKEFNIEYLIEEINPQEIQRFFSNQVKKLIP